MTSDPGLPRRPVERVVWFVSGLRQSGGGERLLMEGVECLTALGVDVTVVTFKFHTDALFDGRYARPRIVELLAGEERFAQQSGAAAIGYLLRGAWRLRRAMARIKPDTLIVQSEDNAVLAWLATLGTRTPYVALMFGQMFQFPSDLTKYARIFRPHLREIRESTRGYQLTIPLEPPPMSPLRRLLNEVMAVARYVAVRKARSITVFTRQVQWEVAHLYAREALISKGAFSRAIFEHSPPSDAARALGLPSGRYLLTICRLVPKKNVELCLRAFARVAARFPDVTLVVGGRGPEEARLKALAAELRLGARVVFVGYVDDRQLWDYYAACDTLVMLDTADYDLVLYEGLALGRKVVMSTDQDLDETLTGSRFIFPAAPEVAPVAEAMARALSEPPALMTADERAQLHRYTWDAYFRRLVRTMEAA